VHISFAVQVSSQYSFLAEDSLAEGVVIVMLVVAEFLLLLVKLITVKNSNLKSGVALILLGILLMLGQSSAVLAQEL
jgi:hypothetical protein